MTVTGLSASNYLLTSGQKLCITSTGTVTGLIAVDGGTLCNQGKIQTSKVSVSNAGYFFNYGNTIADSLLVINASSYFYNYSYSSHVRLAVSSGAYFDNYGNTTVDYLGDTAATINNNGNIFITYDLYGATGSSIYNYAYMNIGRSFYNQSMSYFHTNCMINVGDSWYNQGQIWGGTSTCGGFKIANTSMNSGFIQYSPGGGTDICDAGSGHLDLNSGTIASQVTNCTCQNYCSIVAGIEDAIQENTGYSLYPNPSSSRIYVKYQELPEVLTVYDVLGHQVMSWQTAQLIIKNSEIELNLEALKSGVYLISVQGKNHQAAQFKIIKQD